MVKVTVSPAARKLRLAPNLPTTLEIPDKAADVATVADVKTAFAAKHPKFYTSRQKLTLKGDRIALVDNVTLAAAGVADGGELEIKDLGPQVSWTTVFVVEYIGPLILHPLFYHFPRIFYGGQVQHSTLQRYVYAMVMLHFLKREYETLFVHRFSHGTMPLFNIFRNSAHYHVLGGLMLAFSVYGPAYSAASPYIRGTIRDSPTFLLSCAAIWLFAEASNLTCHMILRNLRPAGSTKRAIPHGYGFNLVTSPNYFFEIMAWSVVSCMTGSYSSWIFTFAGVYMMIPWALKKHRNYKKEFGKEYPKRNVLIPFIW